MTGYSDFVESAKRIFLGEIRHPDYSNTMDQEQNQMTTDTAETTVQSSTTENQQATETTQGPLERLDAEIVSKISSLNDYFSDEGKKVEEEAKKVYEYVSDEVRSLLTKITDGAPTTLSEIVSAIESHSKLVADLTDAATKASETLFAGKSVLNDLQSAYVIAKTAMESEIDKLLGRKSQPLS